MPNTVKPSCVLVILDGWGHSTQVENNAISQANTPIIDKLNQTKPNILINTSGTAVGLPDGQMGNSEVGHSTIGSGRVIHQILAAINLDIASGEFAKKQILLDAIADCKKNNTRLHIFGLLSDGGIHSHASHIEETCIIAGKSNIKVSIHVVTDGRDTAPKCAKNFITQLENTLKNIHNASIASVSGRYYAMDRDSNWDRIQMAYDAIVAAKSNRHCTTASEAIDLAYEKGETDEFIQPTLIGDIQAIENGDYFLSMNFRSDRTQQLMQAILQNMGDIDFNCQNTKINPITVSNYGEQFPVPILYPAKKPVNDLGSCLSQANKTQLRIAETEKYAHVTFFFNGGREELYSGEERILVQSPKVATYDLQPEMSAAEVTEKLVAAIGKYDCIICNYANGDMVGHTGKLAAAIKATETLDDCLGKIITAIEKVNGNCFITADHGNAECMWNDKTNQPHTAHTSNLVPFIHTGSKESGLDGRKDASLADIAPTILDCMDLQIPKEMTGKSLLQYD